MAPPPDPRVSAFAELLAVVDRLRDPEGGCPWDLEQTVSSLAPSALEEAFELVEAIEIGEAAGVVEEAGDLLMVVALMARIAQDEGRFDLADVAGGVAKKLVRRHPHVFGESTAADTGEVLRTWEEIKAAERRARPRADTSALAGVPAALPVLQRIGRVGAKAIAAGFRWQSTDGALEKVREELSELAEAYADDRREGAGEAERQRLVEELGDLLLSTALLGAYLEIDPEAAARGSLRRFETRFRAMESELGVGFREAPLSRMMEAWQRAKASTGGRPDADEADNQRAAT